MYEVKKIIEYMMTRDVLLHNIEYGVDEVCFDDSEMSDPDFSFMKVDEKYECKIRLLGDVVNFEESNALLCKVLSKCKVGKRGFYKVKTECGVYYIDCDEVGTLKNMNEGDEFFFSYFRKDLVQVDRVVHGYYL